MQHSQFKTTPLLKHLFSSRIAAPLYAGILLLSLGQAQAQTPRTTETYEFYHYDRQGSLLEVYEQTPATAAPRRILSQGWSAWGERRPGADLGGDSGIAPVRPGYTGHRDLPLPDGLVLMGDTRLYDPKLKRFINTDDRTTGGVRGMNRHAYAYNNPLKYVDVDGHVPMDWVNSLISANRRTTTDGSMYTVREIEYEALKDALARSMSDPALQQSIYNNFSINQCIGLSRLCDQRLENINLWDLQTTIQQLSGGGGASAYERWVELGAVRSGQSNYGELRETLYSHANTLFIDPTIATPSPNHSRMDAEGFYNEGPSNVGLIMSSSIPSPFAEGVFAAAAKNLRTNGFFVFKQGAAFADLFINYANKYNLAIRYVGTSQHPPGLEGGVGLPHIFVMQKVSASSLMPWPDSNEEQELLLGMDPLRDLWWRTNMPYQNLD